MDTSGDADHFELLYKNVGHYDSIMALSGGLSTVRLSLQNAYYDCSSLYRRHDQVGVVDLLYV